LSGASKQEVLLSTYVCHPAKVKIELSGPVVASQLVRRLRALPERRLSYRIVFVPEAIGSIIYLSRHLQEMKPRVMAGFVTASKCAVNTMITLNITHLLTICD
jgi:aminopeptidase-like protein